MIEFIDEELLRMCWPLPIIMTMKFTNELFKNLGKPLKNQWCLMLIMSPDRSSRLRKTKPQDDACSVR